VSGLKVSSQYNTAVYSATLDVDGQMIVAVADMDVFKEITPQYVCVPSSMIHSLIMVACLQIEQFFVDISQAPMVVFDGNLPVETMEKICSIASVHNVPGNYVIVIVVVTLAHPWLLQCGLNQPLLQSLSKL
jgi:hypothetical protein